MCSFLSLKPSGRASSTPSSAASIAFRVKVVVTRRPWPSISSSLKPSRCSSSLTSLSMWPFWPPYVDSALIFGNRGSLWSACSASAASMAPVADHAPQDVGVPLVQVLLGGLAVRRVVAGGVVQDAGQDGALLEVQVLGGDVEVRLRRGLDAVRAAAEVDRVEVALEDLLLALLALELQGEDRLLGLAGQAAFLGEVEDLDVLLGDRGRTLRRVAAGVAEGRPDDALRVDPLVGPERLVLGRDDGVLDVLRHLLQGDGLAVLGGVPAELGLAVLVVDERRLRLEVLVRVRDLDRLVEEDERPDGQHRAHEADNREPTCPRAAPSASRCGVGWASS